MPVRCAAAADIPVMAAVLAASFGPDRLFQVMFPFQHQHPEDFERALRESLWLSWYDYRKVLMVSYEVEGDGIGTASQYDRYADERQALIPSSRPTGKSTVRGEGQTITGIAEWERAGERSFRVHGLWGRWDPRLLIKPILSTYYRLRRLILFPNKAAVRPTAENPRPLTYWALGASLLPFSTQFMDAPHRMTHWSLEILAVHPTFQGRGYGRELVEHGLEHLARRDPAMGGDLPACVMAAAGKEEFYRKCGFKELVGYVSEAEDGKGGENPLRRNGVEGGAVLWTR
ncbi:uncharacterized protein Z519_09309 [Cladophialophora bantiana CBS 173.52]|uniref:N-acetyltransferase domain-containing protein n=1 Tax=Cladophialophora bantiana (strain ATCC 10958 / CBS 173.52 / CDC B-1940 / NIH 8579) TaxID=1442370 RepID=A0A0D2HGF3_CLAB1|nr:uncharacterized protein Z519_09309 [Cladophialophora bantiana CBS 173.52]KIW89880.1 hypothetical protein Z519_09309 [Cladophialophora bantiana CBS 173.52]